MLGPDLYGNVVAYLNGESTLRALENWVVPRLPLLLAEPPGFTRELTATVELGLAELSEGLIVEADFKGRLSDLLKTLLPTFTVYYPSDTPQVTVRTTHTSSTTPEAPRKPSFSFTPIS